MSRPITNSEATSTQSAAGTPNATCVYLWPRPCPSWCQDHEDHPATDREGPSAYHARTIDSWPSDLGDQGPQFPIVIEVWNYTYPEVTASATNKEPGAHLRIDGGSFVHPDDAERIAKAVLEGVRLIREDEASRG